MAIEHIVVVAEEMIMKLSAVSGSEELTRQELSDLHEAISRSEFYDFYALAHAMTDQLQFSSAEQRERLLEQYTQTVNMVYDDQIRQLGKIAVSRCADTYVRGRTALFKEYGINIKGIAEFGDGMVNVDNLSLEQMVSLLRKVLATGKIASMFATDTWANVINTFISVADAKTTKQKVIAVDRVHALVHHGGPITDYFQERWLGDALNTRSIASPSEILARASSDVRDLVGYMGHKGPEAVNPLSLLRVSLSRIASDIETKLDGDRMVVTVPVLVYVSNGEETLEHVVPANRDEETYYVYMRKPTNAKEISDPLPEELTVGYEEPEEIKFSMVITYRPGEYVVHYNGEELPIPIFWVDDGARSDKSQRRHTLYELANEIHKIPFSTIRNNNKLCDVCWGSIKENDIPPGTKKYTQQEYNIINRKEYEARGYKVSRTGEVTVAKDTTKKRRTKSVKEMITYRTKLDVVLERRFARRPLNQHD